MTLWTAACQAPLSFAISQSLIQFVSIVSIMPSNHLILCCPPSPPASGSFPMCWLFASSGQSIGASASVLPMSIQYSFRMDWLDRLAVQGTLKSLLQHHSSEASILQCSIFFMIQLSHPYMTEKAMALTIQTFVGKEMSLPFKYAV